MQSNPHGQLLEILSKFEQMENEFPAITRTVKSLSRTYKQTNSKYIDKIIFLAAAALVVGDQSQALALLDFIEEHAVEGKYVHLDASISMARLLRVSIYEESGSKQLADGILKEQRCHYSNLEHYTNPIFEIIEESEEGLKFEEQDEENPHAYLLEYSFDMYMSMVELSGRREELKNRINDGDVEYLMKAKEYFRKKFVFYLTEVPTNSELKKYRANNVAGKPT